MGLQFKIIRKKFFKILLSMVIIISLGVALLFGLMNGVLSLRKSVDKFIKENNYPDIKIITNLEDIDKVDDLAYEKFDDVEYRLALNTIINKDNQILSVKANTYEDEDLRDFYLNEEKDNNSGYYDILVEKRFADDNNIKLGDELKLKIGEEFYSFCVSKIISIPETIGSVPINGMWVGINDYGNVYINRKVLYEETNKKKRELLNEIEEKEEEILEEEKIGLDEYNNAKRELETSKNEYNAKKNELTKKKEELNADKEKLSELKKEYIDITDYINRIEDTMIDSYDDLSDDAKDYIDKIKEEKYPNVQIIIDKTIVSRLSEYTDDTSGKPLDIINKLLREADENIKNIDDGLNKTYSLIKKNESNLEKEKKDFEEKILEAKQELNNKKTEVENIEGLESKVNEILINLDGTSDKEAVLKNILDKHLKDIEVLDSYTYEKSPMNYFISVNIDVMEKLSTIVPIVFYIIILIILFLFVSLMIKQGKKEIAILRLIGKTNNNIKLGFCISNLVTAIIGLGFGFLIGLFPMIYMVEYFKNFFLLPNVVYTVNGLSIIISITATIIVVELATLLATLELDKITPIEILKNEEYQNREISKFTKWITSKFKPFEKFSILVYLRNKSKLILGIICTSATVALMFSSLAYIASKNKIFNDYFDDRIHYTAQIFKNGTITDEELDELRKLDYVENADLLRYFNVKLKKDNKEQDIVINALDNRNKYISIFDKDNNEIAYPESGIILEEHIAKDLGLQINDEVTINGVKLKIVDISFQSLGRVNYISLNDSYKLKSSFDTIVLNMDNDKQDELINKVSSEDNYIYTVFNDEIREYNKAIFDSYTVPAIIIIIFALVIGYIIILNINEYNLLDQKRNLAIFRSLGFEYSEISKSWFIQAIVQWTTSTIIGIPSGILLSKYILKYISSARREFIYASGINEIIFTAILLFIYIYIGHRKCMKNFRKIDIIEEVKDKE